MLINFVQLLMINTDSFRLTRSQGSPFWYSNTQVYYDSWTFKIRQSGVPGIPLRTLKDFFN